jgi:thymidylate synthase ThyX
MSYKAEIILDSVAPCGARLTTFELTYPRMVHSEFMTHRNKSKNSASSRAIPSKKQVENVSNNPVIPVYWGTAKSGMQAGAETTQSELAEKIWLQARDQMVEACKKLAGLVCVDSNGDICDESDPGAIKLNLHKQIANRIVEPWMWITVICSSTDYGNFFALRCHPDAQPEIQKIAYMMKDKYESSVPRLLKSGEWHTPYIQEDEESLDIELKKSIAVARCARVSYLTHDGDRNVDKDIELYNRLINGSGTGHWSPFEHVARAENELVSSGNFKGFTQFRKMFKNEYQGN